MKKTLFATAAAAALAVALPAHAWWHHDGDHRSDAAWAAGHGVAAADNAFHYSAATPADEALARRIVGDLAADPMLNDTTATVAVNGGHVSLSGSSRDNARGDRVEQIARNDAGFGHVSGKIDGMGG